MKTLIRKLLFLNIFFMFSSCFFILDDNDWNMDIEEDLVPGYDIKDNFLREIQLEINKVRLNPSLYAAQILEPRLRRYIGNLYRNDEGDIITTEEGVNAMKECISVLEKTGKMYLLEMEKGLHLAAQFLANDQAISGKKGHIASDGSNIKERIIRYGTPIGLFDEICVYGSRNARDIVICLLVDDGVKNKKNREAILNTNFRKIGISFSSEYMSPEGATTIIELAETYFSH